jgi:hypothetical protein
VTNAQYFREFRVSVKQDSTPDGVTAELQIAGAEAADSGAYFCQASNLYGREHQLVQLLVQGNFMYGAMYTVAVCSLAVGMHTSYMLFTWHLTFLNAVAVASFI